MEILRKAVQIIDAINEWTGRFLSYLIFVVMCIIFGEVVARYIFNSPSLWGMPTSTWIWGCLSILSGGYVLKHGGHVNMGIVYNRFSDRGKAALDVFNSLSFFLFIGVLLWAGWKYGWRSVSMAEHYDSVWSPPIYPIKMMIFLGAFLLAVQGLAKFIRDITLVVTGRQLGR